MTIIALAHAKRRRGYWNGKYECAMPIPPFAQNAKDGHPAQLSEALVFPATGGYSSEHDSNIAFVKPTFVGSLATVSSLSRSFSF